MTQKHTPTPWMVSEDVYLDHGGTVNTINREDSPNRSGETVVDEYGVSKADAAFIVRACNIEGAWIDSEDHPADGQDILMRWQNGVVMRGKWFDSLGYSTPSTKGNHWVGKVGIESWMPAEAWAKARGES